MHEKIPKAPPLQFDFKFNCDSRGGLPFTVYSKFEGLEPKTGDHHETGDHHANYKEILNQTGWWGEGGLFKNFTKYFFCIGVHFIILIL